jgi:glycosyltransferase involved in cell wall biosynthesis
MFIKKNSIEKFSGMLSGRVSIIITNYKKELFLKKAILSCLNQTYKNIEIIVVDDCSAAKKSLNIVKSIGSNKIRYFYTTRNYGHYACCNYAIDKSTGKYITFLGADDTMERDHIKHLLRALKKYKLAGVCSLYSRYDTDGKVVGRRGRLCEASIIFEKSRLIKDIGYFHMVRCAADSEYRERAIRYYGENKFGILLSDSYKALYLSNSLTRDKKTKGGSPGRTKYVNQFRKNLKKGKKGNLYFDYKASLLKFSLTKEVRVDDFDPLTFKEVAL